MLQNCQNLCSKCAPHTWTQVLIRQRCHRKVTVWGLRRLKCAVVCYFQGRIFNPTNLYSCRCSCAAFGQNKFMMMMMIKSRIALYHTDDANVSNLILIITASVKFGTSAFNTVVWWRELGEVGNECISHNFSLFAIILPKIIKVGGNLTKFWQQQFCTVFWDMVYSHLVLFYRTVYLCT